MNRNHLYNSMLLHHVILLISVQAKCDGQCFDPSEMVDGGLEASSWSLPLAQGE